MTIATHSPLATSKWCNKDNQAFYNAMSINTLQANAIATGMTLNKDLNCIVPYLKNAENILEIGAGYGRVIDFFLQEQPGHNITAIERCPHFFDFLSEHYSVPSVELIHADIASYAFQKKFDVILWLWTGISEFSQAEQVSALKKITGYLSENGKIIIDTIFFDKLFQHPLLDIEVDKKYYSVRKNDNFLHCYRTDDRDLDVFCQRSRLFVENSLMYVSSDFFSKRMHVLSHVC